MFVQIKRGETLEIEFIISYAEIILEMILTFVCPHFRYKQVLSPLSVLVIRAWRERSGWMMRKPQAFSDSRVTDRRHKSWKKHSQLWFSHREKEPFTVFKTDLWLTASCINNGDLVSYVIHKNYPLKMYSSPLSKQSIYFSKGWIVFKSVSLLSLNSTFITIICI